MSRLFRGVAEGADLCQRRVSRHLADAADGHDISASAAGWGDIYAQHVERVGISPMQRLLHLERAAVGVDIGYLRNAAAAEGVEVLAIAAGRHAIAVDRAPLRSRRGCCRFHPWSSGYMLPLLRDP